MVPLLRTGYAITGKLATTASAFSALPTLLALYASMLCRRCGWSGLQLPTVWLGFCRCGQ